MRVSPTNHESSHHGWLWSISGVLVRFRWALLLLGIATTVCVWPIAQRLQFDRSIESLFAPDAPQLVQYRNSQAEFDHREFVVVAWREPKLFLSEKENSTEVTAEAAARMDRLTEAVRQVPGVDADGVQSLNEALRFRFRTKQLRELVEGVLVSHDGATTAVVIPLFPAGSSSVPVAESIAGIRRVMQEQDHPTFLTGEPMLVHDTFEYIEQDGWLLFRVALGLLAGVVLLLFRGVRWVVLPVMVVVASIVWSRAAFVMMGLQLSLVSSILNSMIMIIAVAVVIHVVVNFRRHVQDREREAAFRETFVELAPAVFWTLLTTVAGFASLLSSDVAPVRSFGLMMAMGSLMILPAMLTLLPGGMLIGRWEICPGTFFAERPLMRFLGRLAGWTEKYRYRLAIAMLALFALPATGFMQLTIQTDFTENFRDSTVAARSLDFVETNLGGAGNWEVNFAAPKQLTPEYLERVRSLTDRLRQQARAGDSPLTKVVSLTDGLELVPEIPFVLNTLDKRLAVLRTSPGNFVENLYNAKSGRMRILLRAKERQQTAARMKLIETVRQTARAEFSDAQTTGFYVLLTDLVRNLLRDQLVTFLWAAAGIAAMMTIAFRSLWIGLASLIPNVFPIVLVVGTMGWIGLPVNMATAMLACVSMGLTVDGTIHYLTSFRRAREHGATFSQALKDSHEDVGRAIVFATLALVVGFLVLIVARFVPLIHFGVLISVALTGGVIADLLQLPLLLQLHEGMARMRTACPSPRPQPAEPSIPVRV